MGELSNEEILKHIELAKEAYKKGEYVRLTKQKDLTTDERFKLRICRVFVEYANKHKLTTTELSELMLVPRSRISEIVNYKITKFTVDKLFFYLETLAKESSEISKFLEMWKAMTEIPLLSPSQTAKFTNNVKKFNAGLLSRKSQKKVTAFI